MATPCWPVLIVMRFYAIPKGLFLLPISCNRILGDVKHVATNLTLFVTRKISTFATTGKLGRRGHGQTRISRIELFPGLSRGRSNGGPDKANADPTTFPSLLTAPLDPQKNPLPWTHKDPAVATLFASPSEAALRK
jgi:hypothetical protein